MLGMAKRRHWAVGSLTVVTAAAMFISACGGGGGNTPATNPTPTTSSSTPSAAGPTAVVSSGLVKSAFIERLGLILTDANGFTLYHLGSDSGNGAGCTGACLATWPPLLIKGTPQAGESVNANFLSTISRPEGTQVTYNGFTLYRFSGDKAPGDAKGQLVIAFGGKWTAVTTAGVLSQTVPFTPTPSS